MQENKYHRLNEMYLEEEDNLYVPNNYKGAKNKRIKITYKEYRDVIRCYFDIKMEWLFKFGDKIDIKVPILGSSFALRKIWQKRAYHVLTDRSRRDEYGEFVKEKVPIKDDWYSCLLLVMHNKPNCRVKTVFSKRYNLMRIDFVKKIGLENLITNVNKKK